MTADDNSNLSDDDAHAESADGDRVAKVLARAGVASRREIERMIEAGRVSLNGKTLTTPAIKIGPGDKLRVDGKVVDEAEPARVWRYHKPVGLVTSHNDPKGRPTVFDQLPKSLPRVISIGRLDLNSEGLLLLTNDGELARALELPGTGLRRRYRARARGRITQEKLDTLKAGITVEGIAYGPIEATLDKAKELKAEGQTSANLWITLTLSEGKNREVRKVLDALGLTVNRLIRQAYGPFQLGDIAIGQVEEIGPRVIREQLAQWIAPEKLPQGSSLASMPVADPKIRTGGKGMLSGDAAAKTYKPGWAKPKIKASHPKRPDGKSRRPKPKA
jgi:23S rRNA pseudouridine2605 synthase